MQTLCVVVKDEAAKDHVMATVAGNVHREGNPVTFWVDTPLSVDKVKRIPGVVDAIVSCLTEPIKDSLHEQGL